MCVMDDPSVTEGQNFPIFGYMQVATLVDLCLSITVCLVLVTLYVVQRVSEINRNQVRKQVKRQNLVLNVHWKRDGYVQNKIRMLGIIANGAEVLNGILKLCARPTVQGVYAIRRLLTSVTSIAVFGMGLTLLQTLMKGSIVQHKKDKAHNMRAQTRVERFLQRTLQALAAILVITTIGYIITFVQDDQFYLKITQITLSVSVFICLVALACVYASLRQTDALGRAASPSVMDSGKPSAAWEPKGRRGIVSAGAKCTNLCDLSVILLFGSLLVFAFNVFYFVDTINFLAKCNKGAGACAFFKCSDYDVWSVGPLLTRMALGGVSILLLVFTWRPILLKVPEDLVQSGLAKMRGRGRTTSRPLRKSSKPKPIQDNPVTVSITQVDVITEEEDGGDQEEKGERPAHPEQSLAIHKKRVSLQEGQRSDEGEMGNTEDNEGNETLATVDQKSANEEDAKEVELIERPSVTIHNSVEGQDEDEKRENEEEEKMEDVAAIDIDEEKSETGTKEKAHTADKKADGGDDKTDNEVTNDTATST